MAIDFHCHAGLGDLMTHPSNTAAPLEAYFRRAQAAGIHKTVVMSAFHSDYRVANAALSRLVSRHSDRLVGFAMIHAKRDRGRIHDTVSDAVRRYGFRGIKVHGHDAFPTREVCEAAKTLRIPILVDVFGQPHIADLMAEQYPQVNFIVPHFGSFADDWKVIRQVIDLISRRPNVYADTSGVRQFDLLVEAHQRAGAKKILFGSDGPWIHPGLELMKIKLMKLSRQDESLILGGNAVRLLSARRRLVHSSPAIAMRK